MTPAALKPTELPQSAAQELEKGKAQTIHAFDSYLGDVRQMANSCKERGPGEDKALQLLRIHRSMKDARSEFIERFEGATKLEEKLDIVVRYNSWLRSQYMDAYSYVWRDMLKDPGNTGVKFLKLAIKAAKIECTNVMRTIDRAPVSLTDGSQEKLGTKQVWEVAEHEKVEDYITRLQGVIQKLETAGKMLDAGSSKGAAEFMRDAVSYDEMASKIFNKHLYSRAVDKGIELRREQDPWYKDTYKFFTVDHAWVPDLAILTAGVLIPPAAPGAAAYFMGRGAEESALGIVEKDWKRVGVGLLVSLSPAAKLGGILGSAGKSAGITLIGTSALYTVKLVADASAYGWSKQDVESLAANGVMMGVGFLYGPTAGKKSGEMQKLSGPESGSHQLPSNVIPFKPKPSSSKLREVVPKPVENVSELPLAVGAEDLSRPQAKNPALRAVASSHPQEPAQVPRTETGKASGWQEWRGSPRFSPHQEGQSPRKQLVISSYLNDVYKLTKKDGRLRKALEKAVEQVMKNPEGYKHLSEAWKGYMRMHVADNHVLIYKMEGGDVRFVRFDHHDHVYRLPIPKE